MNKIDIAETFVSELVNVVYGFKPEVSTTVDMQGTAIELKVPQDKKALLIGHKGQNIKALRDVCRIWSRDKAMTVTIFIRP